MWMGIGNQIKEIYNHEAFYFFIQELSCTLLLDWWLLGIEREIDIREKWFNHSTPQQKSFKVGMYSYIFKIF